MLTSRARSCTWLYEQNPGLLGEGRLAWWVLTLLVPTSGGGIGFNSDSFLTSVSAWFSYINKEPRFLQINLFFIYVNFLWFLKYEITCEDMSHCLMSLDQSLGTVMFRWDVPHSLRYLTTWSVVGSTVWGYLGIALLEKMCYWRKALRFQKSGSIPSLLSLLLVCGLSFQLVLLICLTTILAPCCDVKELLYLWNYKPNKPFLSKVAGFSWPTLLRDWPDWGNGEWEKNTYRKAGIAWTVPSGRDAPAATQKLNAFLFYI